MSGDKLQNWTVTASLAGALLWAILTASAGRGNAPLGVIELLFSFAPLVVVPLGLALAAKVSTPGVPVAENLARVVQPGAAACVVISFWLPPGTTAGALATPWVVTCLLVALSGLIGLFQSWRRMPSLVANIARMDLALAGGWLLLSRLGIHPMGFQEPIVLLTAVHFHYSGFATALIAAAGLQAAQRKLGTHTNWHAVALAVACLPFLLAAGFVFSPLLRATAAGAFSISVALLASFLFREAGAFRSRSARIFLRAACLCVWVGMAWAVAYALGDYLHLDWITIPQMASRHGVLNALGFVMPALLAWLIEVHTPVAKEIDNENRDHGWNGLCGTASGGGAGGIGTRSGPARPRIGSARSERPVFAAREFYDT
jgi:hypothetical protein